MDLNTVISQMEDVGDDLLAAYKKWERAHESLVALRKTNPSLKDNKGKLTEAGRQRMKDMLADGKTNTEIATFFGIAPSAVSYHRKALGD
jgi:DNA-binding NarL/FixJ family response regulator